MTPVRCGNCDHWLGESPTPLVFIETVPKGQEVRIRAPRDLRLCKSCQRVSVYIAREDLDRIREAV